MDSKQLQIIGLLLLATLLVLVGTRLWSAGQLSDASGPLHLAANDAEVYVELGDSLYVLNAQGRTVSQQKFATLGITGKVVDLQALEGERVLIASSRPNSLMLCGFRDWHCESLAEENSIKAGLPFSVYWDESSDRLLLVNSSRSRLLQSNGTKPVQLEQVDLTGGLILPNTVWMDKRGIVWIADTNHHRIGRFDVNDDFKPLEPIDTEHPDSRLRHVWPTDFVVDAEHQLWVLNSNDLLANADLLVFDSEGAALRRIDLPETADPIALATTNNLILISDMNLAQLHAVRMDNFSSVRFASGDFATALSNIQNKRKHFSLITQLSLYALIPLGIGLLVLLFIAKRKQDAERSPADNTFKYSLQKKLPKGNEGTVASMPYAMEEQARQLYPMEKFQGVTWLEPRQELLRILIYIPLVIVILTVALWMVFQNYLMPQRVSSADQSAYSELSNIFYIMVVFFIVMTFSLWLMLKQYKTRIGIKGGLLYLMNSKQQALEIPAEYVHFTAREIAFGPVTVLLQLGNTGKNLYSDEDINQYIIPAMARGHRLNIWQMQWYQFKEKQAYGIINAGLIVISLLFIIWILFI